MQQEGKIKMWLDHVELEEQAMNQVRQAASLDIIDGMAIMPDCHFGRGASGVAPPPKNVVPWKFGNFDKFDEAMLNGVVPNKPKRDWMKLVREEVKDEFVTYTRPEQPGTTLSIRKKSYDPDNPEKPYNDNLA